MHHFYIPNIDNTNTNTDKCAADLAHHCSCDTGMKQATLAHSSVLCGVLSFFSSSLFYWPLGERNKKPHF